MDGPRPPPLSSFRWNTGRKGVRCHMQILACVSLRLLAAAASMLVMIGCHPQVIGHGDWSCGLLQP